MDKLPSHLEREEDENQNIQHILNYWKTARNHGIEEQPVDVYFIQENSEKLSKINKKLIINSEIEDCEKYIEKIKMFQRTYLKFVHTNKENLKKIYQNVKREEWVRDRFNGRGQTGDQPSGGYGHGSETSGSNGLRMGVMASGLME